MEQFVFNDQGQEILINLFRNNKIVPILGAGISKGLDARKGYKVPGGKELKEYMISEIIRKDSSLKCDKHTMELDGFSQVAQVFERIFPDANEDNIKDYFFNHFTQVKIKDESLKRFLNQIKWDYVYTLNIDNSIEETSKEDWEVFLPTAHFDDRLVSGTKRLYKIHGDISLFLKKLDYDMLVFTEEQYIRSIETNKAFHDCLRSDCENKSLLYIGCSLDDELDLKYSVLNHQKDMPSIGDNYRIYVSKGKLSSYQKERLKLFRITHFVELEEDSDYSRLYDIIYECYEKSQADYTDDTEAYRYTEHEFIEAGREENIEYLTSIVPDQTKLPRYFIKRDEGIFNKLTVDKINLILGRRFSGKTMLAFSILEHYAAKDRYFIPSSVSTDIELAKAVIKLRNALVVFDSNSIDDFIFQFLIENIKEANESFICVVLNTFDSICDLVVYNSKKINSFVTDKCQRGYLSENEILRLNDKLNKLQIAKFSENSNILDNTMRIANIYNKFENISQYYVFNRSEELQMFIWLLVKRKMYYEEMVTLKINDKYESIVEKFEPFIQTEQKKKGEYARHSYVKVIANGRIGMLQLLGEYLYPTTKSDVSTALAVKNQEKVCEAIYQILKNYENVNKTRVKEFIMVDVLNDIFSRVYSRKYLDSLNTRDEKNGNKSRLAGAAMLISRIYKYKPIQDLKADDPNYWLQRAKSIYIVANASTNISVNELYDAVQWSKKAEQDALLLIQKGDNSYWRTKSNAEVETAMLYGKITNKENFSNIESVNNAIGYYYKAFNDSNNLGAIEGIIERSKGSNDFRNLMNYAIEHMESVDTDMTDSLSFLLTLHINGAIVK